MDVLAGYDCINGFIKKIESNWKDNKPILIDNKMTSNYLTIKQLTKIVNRYVDEKIEESHLSIISTLTKLGIENCVKPISIESDKDGYAYDSQYVYVLDELACNEYKENIMNFRKARERVFYILFGIELLILLICHFSSVLELTNDKINLIILLSSIPFFFIMEAILVIRVKRKYKNKIKFDNK